MFYRQYGKRLLDISLTVPGLIVLAPLLLLIAVAVKLGSRGPIFFSQPRVGKCGKAFRILKFRSMIVGAEKSGPAITASGDARVTRVGRYLRRWKLDELPKLWNVVKGEMSLVGPRPELPFYVRDYTEEQRGVFSVRPGITDPAALQYRNEEEILAAAVDHEQFYKDVVLPDKLRLNLAYIQRISLRLDLVLVLMTLRGMPRGPMPSTAISKIHAKTASRVSGEEVLPCAKNVVDTQSIPAREERKG